MEETYSIEPAHADDLQGVLNFLGPFMAAEQILPRTLAEMEQLLRHAFLAKLAGEIVGFVTLEIYNRKLAEIQCLAVSEKHRRQGIGCELVQQCVKRAGEEKVREVMAITATDQLFQNSGFDYALPGQKKALFVQLDHE